MCGTYYPPIGAEPGIYTGLHNNYVTLFEARHGRGALDPAPVLGWEVVSAPFGGIAPPPSGKGMIVKPRSEVRSTNGSLYPNQRECIPVGTGHSEMGHQTISPSSGHITGEGAAIMFRLCLYVHADMAAIIFTIYKFNLIIQLFLYILQLYMGVLLSYTLEIYLD